MTDNKISAGSYDLNRFLFGGYEKDIITTIYGPGGSGKTNFCMIVAVSQARKGNKVIYIDTEGGFSLDRAFQIFNGPREDFNKILENIMLLNPTSFEEQEKDFEKLLEYVRESNISLIIIDSIAMLYRLELAEAIKTKEEGKIRDVNSNLAKQLRKLNEISRKQNIPVIITNQVYSSFTKDSDNLTEEKQISMVGGDLLKYWSKCLIELDRRNNQRILKLKKHRALPDKTLEFEVVNRGIKKKGWI